MTDGFLNGADRRHAVATHGDLAPTHIVMHFTQMGSVRSSIDVLNARGFGYHVLIDRDGTVYQTARFDRMVHHAGASNWRGREALNTFALGVSLANHGPLNADGTSWRAADGTRIAPAQVLVASHQNGDPAFANRGWERFPAAQVASAHAVCRHLVSVHPIREIVRHDDVSIGRKVDTGPAFGMAPLRALVRPHAPGHGARHRVVTQGGTALRATHAMDGPVIGRLPEGATVHVLSRSYQEEPEGAVFADWCLVSADGKTRTGFAHVGDLELLHACGGS